MVTIHIRGLARRAGQVIRLMICPRQAFHFAIGQIGNKKRRVALCLRKFSLANEVVRRILDTRCWTS